MANNYEDRISVAVCGETHQGDRRVDARGAHCFQTIRFRGRSMFDDTRYFIEDAEAMDATARALLLRLVQECKDSRA